MTHPPTQEQVERIVVDIASPARWRVQHFWRARGRRVYGIVAAFCPTTLAIGGELFGSPTTARGFALFVGPFWLGAATLITKGSDQ